MPESGTKHDHYSLDPSVPLPGNDVVSGQTPGLCDRAPFDWNNIEGDVHCPLCEYNLRGLRDARCPECGFAFQWVDVLDPRRRAHPYLFEHHPERGAWSWWRTVTGAMHPDEFWVTLHPVQPSYSGRLLRYWLIGAVLFAAVMCSEHSLSFFAAIFANQAMAGGGVPAFSGWVLLSSVGCFVFWAFLASAWFFLTALSLMVFWISMRRARIRRVHVVRCVVYGADPAMWAILSATTLVPPLLSLILESFGPFAMPLVFQPRNWNGILLPGMLLLIWLLSLRRMVAAYRLYLRFDHPRATILCSQVLVLLAAAVTVSSLMPSLFAWLLDPVFKWLGP